MNYMLILYKKDGERSYVGLFKDYAAAKAWARDNKRDTWASYEAVPINLLPET